MEHSLCKEQSLITETMLYFPAGHWALRMSIHTFMTHQTYHGEVG